jgi:hypothetical protein
MAATFNGMSWVYGQWFVGDGKSDWLGTLGIDAKDDVWVLEYRFRYYEDEKAHDSKDRKNWYHTRGPDKSDATRDKFLAGVKMLLLLLEAKFGAKADFVDLQCGADNPKIFFEISSRPWSHMRVATPEEEAAIQKAEKEAGS